MKNNYAVILIVLFSCFVMGYVDAFVKPEYFTKSAIKIILFVSLPLLFFLFFKDFFVKTIFISSKKALLNSFLLGLFVYFFIVFGYFLLRDLIDLSNITTQLSNNIGVDASNFIFVALYISIVNSFLEEFFFRGFAFKGLIKFSTKTFAYIFSSLSFSLYHLAMMIGWFSLPVFFLSLLSLFAVGIIFNWLNEKFNCIYSSWIVHLFANLGINTVGLVLFGIL